MHALLELYDYTEFPIIGELLGRFAVLDNDGRKNALEYMNFLKSIGKFPATKGKFYKTIVAGHVGTWCIGIPLCLLAAYIFKRGIVGVYTLLTTEEIFRLVVSLIIFKRRKWMISLS